MAQILFHGLSQLGFSVVCIESRQAYQALKLPTTHKTDRNDARGLAHLARTDRTTDERFLAQVFADAWATTARASPNWNDPAPRVRLYRFDGNAGQNIPALVAVVANAGMHYPMRNEAQDQ